MNPQLILEAFKEATSEVRSLVTSAQAWNPEEGCPVQHEGVSYRLRGWLDQWNRLQKFRASVLNG